MNFSIDSICVLKWNSFIERLNSIDFFGRSEQITSVSVRPYVFMYVFIYVPGGLVIEIT